MVKPGKPVGSEQHGDDALLGRRFEGNAVAVTYTLNGGYGNGITVPGLGFLLNNEMDDFSAKPGTRTCSAWCRARTTRSRRASGRCRR
jgi:hypothetical protein